MVVESVDSSSEGIETETISAKMVVKRKMPIDSYPVGNPLNIRHPPPLAAYGRNRPREMFEPTNYHDDAPFRTPLALTTVPLVIREPIPDPRPTFTLGLNIISFLTPPAAGWQSVLKPSDQPLPITSSVRN